MLSIKEIMEKRKIKGSSGKGFITDSLRYISWPFTILFYYLGLSPNQVTIMGIVFVFIPAYFISLGGKTNSIIGSILLIVWFMFDLADGEIARCREKFSPKGSYVDRLYHDISMPVIYFSLGMNAYHFFNHISLIYLGFLTSLFVYTTNVIGLNKVICSKEISGTTTLGKSSEYVKKSRLINFVINLFNHPQKMMLYLLVLSLSNLLHYAIFFYAFFNFIIMVFKFIIEYKSGLKSSI